MNLDRLVCNIYDSYDCIHAVFDLMTVLISTSVHFNSTNSKSAIMIYNINSNYSVHLKKKNSIDERFRTLW